MPVPVIACLVAVVLAGVTATLTPVLLRWLPVPPDEPEVAPFSDLDSVRFRWQVFAVAAIAGAVAFGLTPSRYWAVWAPLAALGALLGLIDLRTTYLPLRLNHLALGLALAGAAAASWLESSWSPLLWSAAGAAGAAGVFWVVWRFGGGRMGFGDVRLAGLIGAVAATGGLVPLVWSFLLGTVVGAAWGIVARVRRGKDGEFPYGPALLLGPFLMLALWTVWRPA